MPRSTLACAIRLWPVTGISTTMRLSKISGCLEYDPEPYRYVEGVDGKILMDHNRNRRSPKRHHYYETVAREFDALGREEFERRYYTERVLNRIIIAKAEQREEKHQKGLQKKAQK